MKQVKEITKNVNTKSENASIGDGIIHVANILALIAAGIVIIGLALGILALGAVLIFGV